ncbi:MULTISPECIES: MarR family winged helix-turn-helix transcriptional regulator [unclassified Microbacterium]|uniref:MarR family winged helix-turn-helix transcriptional regulator n=1 Tax=unclassified Microbacterium TaxID=2609290 RepID=UPI000EAA6EFA|nr:MULTISPECIES: MarR family transcriptional regulator [unclassified Microbacterium]MBT2486583.1 MarR family transcriptional regulator [Microbacterium sp. ISL-108]RKN69270.1 MarR family transcriptional regulator [Microbacterium sp. CGR2]
MSDDRRRAEALENIDALTLAVSVRSLPRMVGSLLSTQLTIQQLKVLSSIVVSDRSSTSDLASMFEVSLATMSKLVERLVDQGLVERLTDIADQRVRRLLPTSLGRDVIGKIMAARPEMGADILDGLSVDELEALAVGLRAINRELQAAGATDR